MNRPVSSRYWFNAHNKLVIDFARLAELDIEWYGIYAGNSADWSDPRTSQQLAKSTLRHVFNVDLDLLDDRLCPAIPSRWDYIFWIQQLIDTTGPNYSDEHEADRNIKGIDIGTGSSCVYPMLGCSARKEWSFVATEIDAKSYANASANVARNQLDDRITLVKKATDEPLFPKPVYDSKATDTRYASFSMCNPPFYASETERQALQSQKASAPSASNTGAHVELITDGGEIAFVKRHLKESRTLGCAVQWYTTLIGRLTTLKDIIEEMKSAHITNWLTVPIQAGEKTRRWIIAWSFDDYRPPMALIRRSGAEAVVDGQIYCNTESIISEPTLTGEVMLSHITSILHELNLQIIHRTSRSVVCIAYSNVWGRAARRKRKRGEQEQQQTDIVEPALVAKMTAHEDEASLTIRWMRGKDRGIFDSFCACLKKDMRARCCVEHGTE